MWVSQMVPPIIFEMKLNLLPWELRQLICINASTFKLLDLEPNPPTFS